MANITPLTEKLKLFNDTVTPKLSSMDSEKNDIAMYLNDAITSCDSAISGISSTIPDDQGKTAVKAMALIKDALEVMKTSITNDMGDILAECKKISEEIAVIEAEIARGNQLTPGFWEKVWNEIVGLFTNHWCENDAGEIKRINEKVEQSMKALEAQLDAIASSSAAVKLGIVGNMVSGGTLGAYVSFDSTYSFNIQEWKQANPIVHTNIFDKAGCFIVGQVEGVIDLVEGVVDFVLTPVACVTSLLGWDGLENAIKYDVSEKAGDLMIDGLEFLGLQEDKGARNSGKFVGQLAGAVAISMVASPAAGLALLSMSTGGVTVEDSLKNGDSMGAAALKGGGMAALTFVVGKAAGPIVNKLTKVPVVGKVVTKLNNVMGNFGKILTGNAGKIGAKTWYGKLTVSVVNFVSKPAQFASKVLITNNPGTAFVAKGLTATGDFINNTKLGQSLADTKVGKFLGFEKNITAGTVGGPDTSVGGTPTDKSGMLGLKEGETAMKYNDAQKIFASKDHQKAVKLWNQMAETDFLDCDDLWREFDKIGGSKLIGEWEHATASAASHIYGSDGPVNLMPEGKGNWYQRAENAANFYSSAEQIGNPGSFDKFTEGIYSVSRVNGPGSVIGIAAPPTDITPGGPKPPPVTPVDPNKATEYSIWPAIIAASEDQAIENN